MTDTSDPTQIGRYRILKPLGQGAMATVYLAELATLGGFRRKVALKVVRDEFARDAKFGQLMAREAMIGSLLQHPNIVETLEFNEADGRMFLALEFVEGQTVEDLIKAAKGDGRPSLSLVHSLEIAVQVLQGLAYAHSLESDEGEGIGIVHRDLKPGNIMVSRHGQVKVMDFGIAKAKVAMATITAAGQVRGTPIYMAPEQVTGQALDGRADQFAAATVLYEMLTGKQVFIARNLIEIMRAVSRADVQEPLGVLAELHPGLPGVLGRMWSRQPDERYASCKLAASDLQALLVEEQRKFMTLTPVPKDPEVEKKAPRRRRKKEPEHRGGVFGLMDALGLGRKKAKVEEPPPRKRRRKKRRPEGAQPAAAAPPPSEDLGDAVVFVDDTTFGEGTDEQSLVAPAPAAPTPEPAKSPGTGGPALLGPDGPATPDPPAEPSTTSAEAVELEPTLDVVKKPTPEEKAAWIERDRAENAAPDPDATLEPQPTAPAAGATADPFAVPTAAGLKARPDLLSAARPPRDSSTTASVDPGPELLADASLPTDVPTAPAMHAAPELLMTEPGPSTASSPAMPRAPLLPPRVGGGRGRSGGKGGPPPEVDPGDMPTPSMLRPLSPSPAEEPPQAPAAAPPAPPPSRGLMPDLAFADLPGGPMPGPTRPMEVIDVRAALAAAEGLATPRMPARPELLAVENDLRTRPMAVQPMVAEAVRRGAQLGPAPEDEVTAADEKTPRRDASLGDDPLSGELDPFFFED